MTTITQGTTGTYTFAANEMATLALTESQQVRVEVIDAITLKVKYGATTSVSQTFGPFNSGDTLVATAVRGSVVYSISTYTPPVVGGISTLSSATDYTTALVTPLNAKLNIAPGWDGTTPALASGVNPITAGFASNAFVFTGAGTSPALDGQTGIAGDTFIFGFGGSSTWTKFAARTGVPVAFATGHTFVDADDTAHVIATGTPAYTLPTGRAPGWGVSIDGAFTLTGGLTIGSGVTDIRATTGTAFCSIVQTDTSGAGATYKLVGTK